VIVEALEAIAEGDARELEFGVSDGDAFAVGLACGGTIRILLEPVGKVLSEDLLAQLVAARAERRPVAYVVDLSTGTRSLAQTGYQSRFSMDRSGFVLIVGAVHIAQALVPMAKMAGYDVQVVDPRESFASTVRFPEVALSDEWPSDAAHAFGLDARTALVLLTHDPKLDDPVLHLALKSGASYIGALGSKRTHAKRLERLQAAGFSAAECARIQGPIGLDLGAANPAEIAISIIAQMVQMLRKPVA